MTLGKALHTSADCNQVISVKCSEVFGQRMLQDDPKGNKKRGEMLPRHTQNCILEITFPSSPLLLLLQTWHRSVKSGQAMQRCVRLVYRRNVCITRGSAQTLINGDESKGCLMVPFCKSSQRRDIPIQLCVVCVQAGEAACISI